MKRGEYHTLGREWFKKAREDWEAALVLRDERFYFATILWHVHQAVEKWLKGFLVWHRKDIEDEFKTHNLLKLYEYAQRIDEGLGDAVREACLMLNRYYLVARYPIGSQDEFTEEEVETALKMMDVVRQAIEQCLGRRVR